MALKHCSGDTEPNLCSDLHQHGRVLAAKVSVATVASQANILDITTDRHSSC